MKALLLIITMGMPLGVYCADKSSWTRCVEGLTGTKAQCVALSLATAAGAVYVTGKIMHGEPLWPIAPLKVRPAGALAPDVDSADAAAVAARLAHEQAVTDAITAARRDIDVLKARVSALESGVLDEGDMSSSRVSHPRVRRCAMSGRGARRVSNEDSDDEGKSGSDTSFRSLSPVGVRGDRGAGALLLPHGARVAGDAVHSGGMPHVAAVHAEGNS